MRRKINRGLGLMALAVALVGVSLWMLGSTNEAIAGNAGPTGIAALTCGVVGAVLIARALMSD